jgi:hypothetical protein
MIRWFALLCSILLLVGSLQARTFSYQQATVITQSGAEIPVEVSDTPAKRQQGLSDRPRLKKGWGMLFVFEHSGRHGFWMKDMNFPIDILWLRNRRVVYVAENIPPPSSGESSVTVTPDKSANLVLELDAGQARALDLSVGSILDYRW